MRTCDILIEFCLIFLIIFTPFAYGAVQPWAIAVFEVTAALMFLSWIFKILKSGKFEFVRSPLTPFIFLFIFYVSLQFFLSRSTVYGIRYTIPGSIYSWATKTELLKILSYALVFVVTINTIKTRRQIARVLSVIIIVGFVMSIFYLMRYFGTKAPRGIINSDHFSAYLGMIIPLTLGFFFISSQTETRKPQTEQRILLFFTIITMGAALLFTMSRGGMFSFIFALLFIAILVLGRKSIRKNGWTLSTVVMFIILTIGWLGATPVVERILSIKAEIASRYFGGRLPIWQGTVDIIKDFPIFGTGLGTFNYIFPKYQPAEIIARHYTYAHSDFLELLSEVGTVGFLLFLVFGFWFFVYIFKRFRQRHNFYVVGISIGLFGSLASIFLHSFTDFNLHIPANAILLTIILSLFLSVLNYKQDDVLLSRPKAYNLKPMTCYALYPVAVLLAGIFMVTSLRPAVADHYYRRAVLADTDNREPKTELLERAIALDSTNAKYYYQLGKLYGKLSAFNSQLSAYKKAVELNPANSKYHQSLAWAYGRLADLLNRDPQSVNRLTSLAREHFQTAIRLETNNPYRHRTYGMWLLNHSTKENIEKGVVEYRKAIELKPSLAEEALTKYYKYQKDYEKLVDILPGEEESDYTMLKLLIEEKGLKFAVDFAEKFLKTYPYNAKVHFSIADGSFYDKNYPWEFTERHYKIAFENDAENAYYRMWRGIHLYIRREYKKALKDLEMAMAMGLGSGNEKQAREHIAKCKMRIGSGNER